MRLSVALAALLALGCSSSKPVDLAKKTTEVATKVAKDAAGKAVDVVIGTPPPTLTPTPTPTPFFTSTVVKMFPRAATWRPPELPAPVIAVDFKVLTATEPAARRGPPRLAPDGRQVAYDEGEGAKRRLIVRSTLGEISRNVRLPAEHSQVRSPFRWAPGSTALVFTREVATGDHALFVLDLEGSERLIDPGPVVDGQMAWSPAGDRIAFIKTSAPGTIWTVRPDGTQAHATLELFAPVQDMVFSPDGSRLAFAAGEEQHDIFVASDLETASAAAVRVTRWYFDDVLPAWSLDGERLAFFSTFNHKGKPGVWSLFVVASDGRDPVSGIALAQRQLLAGVQTPASRPTWLPQRDWPLVVKEAERGYWALWAVNPKNRDQWRLDPETRVNQDVVCGKNGIVVFRARKEWAEHIVVGLLYASETPFTTHSWP